MYLRFCTYERCRSTHGASWGMFYAASEYISDPATPDWLADEISKECKWFNQNLPFPKRLAVKSRKRWRKLGVCWFRSEALVHIKRAWGLKSLIEEAGGNIIVLRRENPGELLYEDSYQVVAKDHKGYRPAAISKHLMISAE